MSVPFGWGTHFQGTQRVAVRGLADMARTENKLTAREVQIALRKGEKVVLQDGGSLYFTVEEKNSGFWWFRGRLNGVSKRRVLGHQDMTLAEARLMRNDERKALKEGIDTIAQKREQRKKAEAEERTFGMVADEWLKFWQRDKDDKTIQSTVGRLNKHILPILGNRSYITLAFADLKDVCTIIATAGHREMANRVSTIINQICRFAKINGYHQYNIAEDLTSLFPKPKRDTDFEGFPAITDKAGVAEMLGKISRYIASGRCSPFMEAALRLFPYIPLRGSSMLSAEWEHINFDTGEWIIPAQNMKGEIGKRNSFIIPMSRQVTQVLQELSGYRYSKFLFHSGGKVGHLTVEGVNKSMHLAGIPKGKMCVHGWRKVWGSLAREFGVPDKIVERGLAHVGGSAVEMAYNKAQYKELMRYVFQWWCDALDALKNDSPVDPLKISEHLLFS